MSDLPGFPDARGGPPGRNNALTAPSYSRLLAVDARVLPALLDSLEDAGVAAYSTPSPGERGGYLETRLPTTPTEDLYVDASRREEAQLVLAAELPGLLAELRAGPAEEEEFARIVAGFDEPIAGATPPWPTSEDIGPVATTPAREDESVTVSRGWTRGPDPVPENDEHFVPPPPPPVPRPQPVTFWAWAAILAGAAVLLWHAATAREVPTARLAFAVATIVGGIATLVWRMRDRTPDDFDPDDGAVV